MYCIGKYGSERMDGTVQCQRLCRRDNYGCIPCDLMPWCTLRNGKLRNGKMLATGLAVRPTIYK